MKEAQAASEFDRIDSTTRPVLIFPGLRDFYDRMREMAYATMRVGFGLIMMTHGVPKVFGLPHGTMANPLAVTTSLIENVLHLPAAAALAYFAGLLETFGGLAIAAGLGTRFLGLVFTIYLAVIAYVMGSKFGFPWGDRGAEYPILWGLMAFYITFYGGGRYSVDWKIGREL